MEKEHQSTWFLLQENSCLIRPPELTMSQGDESDRSRQNARPTVEFVGQDKTT